MYLIDNGYLLILYTKVNCNPKLLYSIYGVKDLSQINGPVMEDTILIDPDQNKQKLMNIIDYIRRYIILFIQARKPYSRT